MNKQEEIENENIYEHAEEKIQFGESLRAYIAEHPDIDGLQKLSRKINQELKFLHKVYKNGTLKKEHLQCSNLTHFSALVDTLKIVENCQSVNKIFTIDDRKTTVDIICDNGLTWIKVVARNPKSLSQIYMGNASYGVRSIVDQAREYVECAKTHPCLFQTPKVIFVFTNGIGNNLANKLEKNGIVVRGQRIEDYDILESESDSDFSTSEDENEDICLQPPSCLEPNDLSTQNIAHIKKVNLDVSAMLAYCCSVANGSAHLYDFDVPVLKQQAEWERQRPVKPILDKFFEGKKLYCCQTAKESFENIVNTVGGPKEKVRAEEFLKRVTVLPDNATCKDTAEGKADSDIFNQIQFTANKSLAVGGKIRQRSLTIFMFGDRIQAITVTSNDGFVRAARQQFSCMNPEL
ncbi:UPF0415 protein C7orf25 homolog isoform X2 [Anthonomus grandis grandis]|uniref:UPF0415 protein C7orf25 homolog isoform X2 n=1 Tax=Anthonomus grandis grandis TaxID=2921223 RepID=UPI00216542DD|nr:UPF0415 protein C7orf25 homolog isoform X2 [Anthonomus grandis grandis]